MSDPENGDRPRVLEIDTASARRWRGRFAYAGLFLFVAILLVAMFARFTSSMTTAIILVSFMIAYMAVMGWLTSRNLLGRK